MVLRIVVVALLLAGCEVARPTFECASWEDCGPGGACEPDTKACSFADESCVESGRRFSSISPEPHRDRCVEYLPNAPAAGLCRAQPSNCGQGRACLDGRCVSTVELDTGKLLTCGRCALAPNTFGPLVCWGETGVLSPFAPVLLQWPGHQCPAPEFCPSECAMCPTTPAQCPMSCIGSDVTVSYAVGENHFCFNDGQLYCVGSNSHSQLGKGTPDIPPGGGLTTVRMDPIYNYRYLAAGPRHNCGRGVVSDRVFCWGDNTDGQLDMTDMAPRTFSAIPLGNAPFTISGGVVVGVEFVAVSAKFSCGTSAEDVRCWGDVPWGAGLVMGLPPGQITDFSVGLNHACAIKAGRVVCWGGNRQGQTDPALLANMSPPTTLLATNAKRVVAGRAHTCAIDEAGAVWCWGESSEGQLDGAVGPGPVRVRADPPAVGPISAGDDVTCGGFADDRIRCWGDVLQTDAKAFRDFTICER